MLLGENWCWSLLGPKSLYLFVEETEKKMMTYRCVESQPEWSEDAEEKDCQGCAEQHSSPCRKIIL